MREDLLKTGTLDLRSGDASDDDPAAGDDWPADRTLSNDVLREVLTSPGPRIFIAGARIQDAVDLEGMNVVRSLVFEDCYFDEQLNLRNAELVSLVMTGCRVARGIDANGCRIRGGLDFGEGFHAGGEVVLAYASVGGNIVATGGRFLTSGGNALMADGVSVEGGVFLRSGFEAEGAVRLIGANIRGPLDCAGGRIRNPQAIALMADGVEVDGAVFLNKGFRAEGEVRLTDARIRGALTCEGGVFISPGAEALSADRMRVHGGVFFLSGFQAEGEVRLNGVVIEGQFALVDGQISNPRKLALDLESSRVGGPCYFRPGSPFDGWVDLSNAHLERLSDSAAAWAGGYELAGCRYSMLESAWEENNKHRLLRRDTAVEQRLEWLAGNRSGYVPQLYDQLSQVYAAAGEEAHYRDAQIAKQRRRRGQLPWYAWVWSVAIDVLIGFGYRTGRALIPFFVFLAVGTWYFASAYDDGDMVPRSTAETMNVPPFRPFIYSLDQLVPVVNFGQRENWVAVGTAQTLTTTMIIVGWVLTTAILAALTGLVRRNQ